MVDLNKTKQLFLRNATRDPSAAKGRHILLGGVQCKVSKVEFSDNKSQHIVYYTGHSVQKSGYFYAGEARWELAGAGDVDKNDGAGDVDGLVLKYMELWFGPVQQADMNPRLEVQRKGEGREDNDEEWGEGSFSQFQNGTEENGTIMFFSRHNLQKNNLAYSKDLDWWVVLNDVEAQAGKKERGILSDMAVDQGTPAQTEIMAECTARDFRQIFRCIV